MSPDIDFTRGGYMGDVVEETFKPFTSTNMEYWWHFREVLVSGLKKGHPYWGRSDKQPLADDEWRDLIALSLINYAVYTSVAESIGFYEQMLGALSHTALEGWRIFEVRRSWKAMYSSLYTAFTALSNIICIVVGHAPVLTIKGKSKDVRNWTPSDAAKIVGKSSLLDEPFNGCRDRLAIRNQLDHYWTIWMFITKDQFQIDHNYLKKGYIALEPDIDVKTTVNAVQRSHDDVMGSVHDFNLIYKQLAVAGGYLDTYLQHRGWVIDYSSFGSPHNGQRPKP